MHEAEPSGPTTTAADAAGGEASALERLAREFGRFVHGIVVSHAPADQADDLVQDVLLAAVANLGRLREPRALGAWLATTARRRAIDALRRRRAEDVLPEQLADRRASAHPAATAEAHEALDALKSLPEAYRETLALRLIDGLSGPEIAHKTGLTPGSVRVNLHRGLALLRAKLNGGSST
jgi:RNA polymerase sigma-70 factor, ECF subfamily